LNVQPSEKTKSTLKCILASTDWRVIAASIPDRLPVEPEPEPVVRTAPAFRIRTRKKPGEVQNAFIAALKHGPLTRVELAAATGHDASRIGSTIRWSLRNGTIHILRDGRFALSGLEAPPRKLLPLGRVMELILEAVGDRPVLWRELRDQIDAAEGTLNRALASLCRRQLIQRIALGTYQRVGA
jgi:hypothetical protein